MEHLMQKSYQKLELGAVLQLLADQAGSAEGKARSINSAKEVRTRKDVTKEKVAEFRNKGLTIAEIAKKLNCGINTVNRRLGMKDY